LPAFVFGHLRYVRTNAQVGAPVADGSARFPVLVCAHGRGGFRQEDTWLVEELVSSGYVVACMDQPHAASGVDLPGGRRVPLDPRMMGRRFVDAMVPYLAQDASFTLDQLTRMDAATSGPLTGRLDLARTGMFGLSLGGEVTAQACHQDRRFAACLMMDVWMPADVVASGLRQPSLLLTRDAATMRAEGWGSADIDDTLTSMRAVFRRLSGRGWFVSAPGMYHQDFSDAPLFSPLTQALGVTGPVTPSQAHAITTGYTLGFFDVTLRNRPSALLAGTARPFPEVTVERR
jgi:dienelactone hydrolase